MKRKSNAEVQTPRQVEIALAEAEQLSRDAATRWDDITRQDLDAALAVVIHSHDPVAARNLIEYFHEHMLDVNRPEIEVLLAYIRHAFGRIVEDGKSADVAFGLTQARGEYDREFTADRDVIATAFIVLLMRNGWTWLDAKGEAINKFFPYGTGERAVDYAYKAYKDELQNAPDQLLRDMLPPGTAVIKRDMTV